ncbi:hypothetical protein PRIPAC_80311 [Pristionchus pacificus]|uniref:Nuclear receptor n=1 Tax=Pristionchus pacificus TaxID=54126 RepID=A0A2A6C385_PRIPA|nr:hypothetical protein PRIPAC_80311 [Pristionchus pacificus]|eukprot:PDM72568.1 nuclear receptor [Pristionchus pacificus]
MNPLSFNPLSISNATFIPKMNDVNICLICSSSIRETSAGFDVCRACTAFFKRTQNAGRKYICRQGTNDCIFRKHEKFMCRSCRYDGCLKIGMGLINTQVICSPLPNILERIRKNYKQSVNRRMKIEEQLAKVLQLKRFNENEELFMCNIEFFYLIYPSTFRELISLFRNILPDFANFPDTLKASIFTNLIGKFNALEYYFLSVGKFMRLGVCMCSLTTVFDIDNIEEWATTQGGITNQDLVRSVRTFAVEYFGIFDRLLQSKGITETEFIAVIGILVCQMDTTIELPDRFHRIFDDIRIKVFNELQNYYRRELNLHDFSSRLGNIMSLSTALSELHLKSEEQLGLYSFLFNVRPQHELLKQAMDK